MSKRNVYSAITKKVKQPWVERGKEHYLHDNGFKNMLNSFDEDSYPFINKYIKNKDDFSKEMFHNGNLKYKIESKEINQNYNKGKASVRKMFSDLNIKALYDRKDHLNNVDIRIFNTYKALNHLIDEYKNVSIKDNVSKDLEEMVLQLGNFSMEEGKEFRDISIERGARELNDFKESLAELKNQQYHNR